MPLPTVFLTSNLLVPVILVRIPCPFFLLHFLINITFSRNSYMNITIIVVFQREYIHVS